jgi:hypothetical protein
MENMTTDFYKEEKEEEDVEEDNFDKLILSTTSKEFRPSALFTQIEDEIKMAHLRKKYRNISPL